MKLMLAILLGVVAYAFADEDDVCGPLQRYKTIQQWHTVYGEGHHRVEFALELWHRIFHDHPEARAAYAKVRGDNIYHPKFAAYSVRVLSGLDLLISLLDDEATLKAHQAHVKSELVERTLETKAYDIFRDELFELVGEELKDFFDYDAWKDCINHIIAGLK